VSVVALLPQQRGNRLVNAAIETRFGRRCGRFDGDTLRRLHHHRLALSKCG
jgi:hypothetical protein